MTAMRRPWLAVAVMACAGGTSDGPRAFRGETPAPSVPAAADTAEITLYLVGDAGAPDPEGEPVLDALREALAADSTRSLVVFLGDNIYPDGLPPETSPDRAEAERRLDAQLDVISKSGARGVFVAGNHDWGGISGDGGWSAVIRQGRYIAARDIRAVMLPQAGCPGPAVRDVGTVLRLVFLDTQWWLHQTAPPARIESTLACAGTKQEDVVDSLGSVLRDTGGRRVVIMSHHPLATGGAHGGYFSRGTHLFPLTGLKKWLRVPLPMIGSVYVAARNMGVSEQDLSSAYYRHLVEQLLGTFTEDEPLVYAAGHDHNLQVLQFEEGPLYHLVSGSGIYGHVSAVRQLEATRYAEAESGFMRLRAWADGRFRLTVLAVDRRGRTRATFDEWIAGPDRED